MPLLTQDQLGFFARNGYLHVDRLVDEGTCRKLVDHTWTRLPSDWARHDPSTWSGKMLSDSCHVADLRIRRGLFQFQKGDVLDNPVIEGAFASTAIGGQLGRALIGHRLAKMRVRGLYCIAPLPSSVSYRGAAKPHIESHPVQLVALCYLDDVVEGGGGLSVWPGSHREVYPVMGSKLEHVATPEYDGVFAKWAKLKPIEIPGRRGDIVIIHHRLLHAPSLNRSTRIRYGFLCDYQRDDFRSLCNDRPGDLWEDWPAIRGLPARLRDGPADIRQQALDGFADVTPLHSNDYKLSLAHAADTDPSSVRKADASALARMRREGDIWIALSDDPCTAGDTELFPRGSELAVAGVSILVNGTAVKPVCRYDIISRLELPPGEHVIHLEGLERPAWLRVLRMRLPFIRTEFLGKWRVNPGRSKLRFTVPANEHAGTRMIA